LVGDNASSDVSEGDEQAERQRKQNLSDKKLQAAIARAEKTREAEEKKNQRLLVPGTLADTGWIPETSMSCLILIHQLPNVDVSRSCNPSHATWTDLNHSNLHQHDVQLWKKIWQIPISKLHEISPSSLPWFLAQPDFNSLAKYQLTLYHIKA
jgi:hypothetical protein